MSDGITYSFREILDRIERKVDHLTDEIGHSIAEIRKQIVELTARVVQNEAQIKQLDEFGSSGHRSIVNRVTNLESQAMTKAEVQKAIKDLQGTTREVGSHKLAIFGAIVAASFLILSIISIVTTLLGAH